jgi:hypothetical protein
MIPTTTTAATPPAIKVVFPDKRDPEAVAPGAAACGAPLVYDRGSGCRAQTMTELTTRSASALCNLGIDANGIRTIAPLSAKSYVL